VPSDSRITCTHIYTFILAFLLTLPASLPPLLPSFRPALGFHHSPFEVFYSEDESSYVICDPTGEDKHCSNQYYIDANINDHLSYLGMSCPPSSPPSPSSPFFCVMTVSTAHNALSSPPPPFLLPSLLPSLPLGVLFGAEELEGRMQEISSLRGVEVNEGGRVAALSSL